MPRDQFSPVQAQEVAAAFALHRVDYMFIGKSGAILLGYPGTTQDVDVYPRKDRENGQRIVDALIHLGFVLDNDLTQEIVRGRVFVQIKSGPFDIDLVIRNNNHFAARKAEHTMRNVLVLIGTLLLLASAVSAQEEKDRPLITVSGQAELRVPPDEIVFTLSVESVDKDVLAAKKKTDESVKAVFAIAKDNRVSADEVQTSYISVEPKYNTDDFGYGEVPRGTKRLLIGYAVSKTIAIRLKDISRFDSLLSDVLKAGVTKVKDVEFRDSQIRKHRDQARAMAIKAAQEKASLLAREIGQTIGPAFSISEGVIGRYSTSNAMQNTTSVISGDLSASESDSAIAPGLISVTAQVTVSFRLQ